MLDQDFYRSVTYSDAEREALDCDRDRMISLMGKEAADKARWVTQVQANIEAAGLSDQWGVNASGVYRKDDQEKESA
ncbi:MAG: hypothetical protein WAQ25_01560 [Candidatus Saccharimonas sp.]